MENDNLEKLTPPNQPEEEKEQPVTVVQLPLSAKIAISVTLIISILTLIFVLVMTKQLSGQLKVSYPFIPYPSPTVAPPYPSPTTVPPCPWPPEHEMSLSLQRDRSYECTWNGTVVPPAPVSPPTVHNDATSEQHASDVSELTNSQVHVRETSAWHDADISNMEPPPFMGSEPSK